MGGERGGVGGGGALTEVQCTSSRSLPTLYTSILGPRLSPYKGISGVCEHRRLYGGTSVGYSCSEWEDELFIIAEGKT